ncbi:MAG: GNAT family N-acetyltransferase [Peptococcaceae bacterium]|jgi:ribosomal protein S18 acetylase RimI-like enzyme|nr:GNAT family N-acetyltransferase [Peptococcaceae bacterium]
MNITIHRASGEDCEKIYPLICALARGHVTGSGRVYRPPYEEYKETFNLILNDKRKQYYVAKDGDNVVGVVGVALHQSLVEAGNFANIDELVVDETHRRQGIGQRLLAACAAFAKERGCQNITLTSGNARIGAHTFYEKNGFEKVGVKFNRLRA